MKQCCRHSAKMDLMIVYERQMNNNPPALAPLRGVVCVSEEDNECPMQTR